MSIIKQISVYDGSSWGINDIGANAGNIDLIAPSSTVTTNLAGSSNLFTALNNILPTNQLTASRVVITDANKKLATSNITSTQLGSLSGVTNTPIQTQIDTLNTSLDELFGAPTTAIPENANLNTYTNPGIYIVASSATAETISNIPYPVGGRLEVKRIIGTGRFIQFYYSNSYSTTLFQRNYTGEWSTWKMYQDAIGVEITTFTSNLNNLRIPGRYYCATSALAQTLSNCPTTNNFVLLQLIKGPNVATSYRSQVLFDGASIYTRSETSLGWSQWRKITGTAA